MEFQQPKDNMTVNLTVKTKGKQKNLLDTEKIIFAGKINNNLQT